MKNLINRVCRAFRLLMNRSNRGQVPEFFEVPYLRKGDGPEIGLLTAEMIQSVCNIRVLGYSNTDLKTIYFDARNSKGEMWPLLTFTKRTDEEAQQIVKGVVAAMSSWANHKPVVIVVNTQKFNKAA